jgi:hypothetical protein
MYVKVYELTTDNAMCADMKELLAPRPAGYVPYDMRENGCERERFDAIDALNCAVRYAVKHKIEVPFAKEFLNGLYGVSSLQFSDRKGDPDPRAVDNSGDENAEDETRDIYITVNSDHANPQFMHEVAKMIAVLSDTDRDIHVNVI